MLRHLVLFAREPGREAREKGLARDQAADLFARFASDWGVAARSTGARLIVASPPEDRLAWRRCLGHIRPYSWIAQRGASLGERLENSAREVEALGGHAIIVGGDVMPSSSVLENAFAALEAGADAVLAPAEDGGVSLLALRVLDLDLLRTIAPRRADVFGLLHARLLSRGRAVTLVATTPDVDGRRGLRALLASHHAEGSMRAMARRALSRPEPPAQALPTLPDRLADRSRVCLRGPPAAA
jgi:uncharacterized protein